MNSKEKEKFRKHMNEFSRERLVGRMTLDEAIKHAEETAIEQDKLCTRYDNASGYSRSHNEAIRTTDAKRCEECAEEHRQLAEWLRELKQLKEQEFCVTMREVSDDELKHLEERLKTERWQLISVKQEPCDDAISRAETIKYLNINMAWYDEDGEIADSDEKLKAITDLINGVPSVVPKQKTGRWIDTDNYYQRWKCSECGCHARSAPPFCSNCGAKMEVEE